MFFKIALFITAFMAVAVAASGNIDNSCNTGTLQCCNEVTEASSLGVESLIALIGASLKGVTGKVGLKCSPLTAIGVGAGSTCSSQPVCCTNNSFNGVVALGCTPVSLGL